MNPFCCFRVRQASMTLFSWTTQKHTLASHTLIDWHVPPCCHGNGDYPPLPQLQSHFFHTVYMKELCSFTPPYPKRLWCNYTQWQGFQKLWIQPAVAAQNRHAAGWTAAMMNIWDIWETSTADLIFQTSVTRSVFIRSSRHIYCGEILRMYLFSRASRAGARLI